MVLDKMVSGDINNMTENPINDYRLKRLGFKWSLLHFLLADKSVFETQKISSHKQLKKCSNSPTEDRVCYFSSVVILSWEICA